MPTDLSGPDRAAGCASVADGEIFFKVKLYTDYYKHLYASFCKKGIRYADCEMIKNESEIVFSINYYNFENLNSYAIPVICV